MDKEIKALSRVSLFSNMQEDDLLHILSLSQRKTYDKGEVIIKEGDRDRVLYIVLSGLIDIIKDKGGDKEKILRVMGPNSYFGEMALIDEMVRSASVVARENAEVLSIDQLDLKKELIEGSGSFSSQHLVFNRPS